MEEKVPGVRRFLPAERPAITHSFELGQFKFYLTVGLYPDGTPGEVFLKATDRGPVSGDANHGSFANGMCDAFSIAFSTALQYGAPIQHLCRRFAFMKFDPMEPLGAGALGTIHSPVDYVARWMERQFCKTTPSDPA